MSDENRTCPHCHVHLGGVGDLSSCPACGFAFEGASSPPSKSTKGRRYLILGAFSTIVAGLAVAALVYPWDSARPVGDSPRPVAPGSPAGPASLPDSSQPGGPVASLLSVKGPVAGEATPAVVSLRPARYHDSTPNGSDESILAHEVVRQALLFAARDAGAVARDGTIGDPVPAPDAASDLEIGSHFASGSRPVAILAHRGANGREVLATYDLGGPGPKFIDYVALVERAEYLSRSEDGFRKVLRTVGLKDAPAAPRQGDRPAEEIEQRLDRMTFTEPFAAARSLHGEIRDRGETPERLGALARAYANLGALTDFHWNAGAKAFKARALIAAQRAVSIDPKSPRGFWHRAYARSLVGFHKDALADLEVAARLAKEQPASEKAPSWVALVDALCRFRTGDLKEAGSGPDGQLAMFLAFLTAEHSIGSISYPVAMGHAVLQSNPECYRVYDALSRLNGVSNGHWATAAGLVAFTEAVPGRLAKLPGLPDPVAAKLRDGAPEAEVERALEDVGRSEGDGAEPSWRCMGRMVRDGRFALLMRRAHFMKWIWNVPTADFVAEARPLVIDHRYLPLLDSFAVDRLFNPRGFAELVAKVDVPDLDFPEERFVQVVSEADMDRHKALVTRMICHGDTFFHDLALVSGWVNATGQSDAAKQIADMSPYAPLARSQLINADWDYAGPRAKEWEAEAIEKEHPEVLSLLGRRYVLLKRWDDAERCLTRSVAQSPDIEALRLLAQAYQGRGDLDRWQATLERALELEDPGLEHMVVHIDMANHLMGLKQYDKALPHAEAAAATWADRGMHCAAVCHELMGHWEQAEEWVRRQTERYHQAEWLAWFIWCRRTGRGDVASAREWIASFGDNAPDGAREWFGTFHLIDGSPKEALAILVPLQDKSPIPIRGLMIASAADEIGDAALRDRTLAGLEGLPQTRDLKLSKLLSIIRSGLSGGRIDREAAREALREIPEAARYKVGVFAGRLMHGHGAAEFAVEAMKQCRDKLGDVGWAQALASISLREWEKPADGPATTK